MSYFVTSSGVNVCCFVFVHNYVAAIDSVVSSTNSFQHCKWSNCVVFIVLNILFNKIVMNLSIK